MRLLIRLYPAAWRARYEDEFLAVLEERPLSPFDVIDITFGALDARLRPRSLAIDLAPRRTPAMNSRISGYAAIVGGTAALLMVAIGFLVPGTDNNSSAAAYLFPVAAVALLIALIGLSAAQGRRLPVLTWAAAILPAAGLVATLAGLIASAAIGDRLVVGDLNAWGLLLLGTAGTIVGSILFAAATVVVGVLSRGASIMILTGSLVLAVVGLPIAWGAFDPGESSTILIVLITAGVAFCLGWIWLGYAAAFQASATTARVESA
jgi:drug/metabolite transporter (DMT)-like permease